MILRKEVIKIALSCILLGGANVFSQASSQAPQEQSIQKIAEDEPSEVDLQKFANAYLLIQDENKGMKEEILSQIQKEGLTIERFDEIHASKLNADNSIAIKGSEKNAYENALAGLSKIQTTFQEKVESIILGQGLSLDNYQDLALALQLDKDLQQKFQEMVKGK